MTAPDTTTAPAAPPASGLAPAIAAYTIWGFLPLYLLLVRDVPAFEFVGWRIIWTLPLCLLIVAFR
ncbi:MAG TPA: EamA family transporter RarD, partial [Erythrobacter sp.]|nr:EamA family transporter RarD [Erythrobacter sp.]